MNGCSKKMHQAWSTQLSQEHASICWKYSVDLKKPLIELTDSKKKWGSWDPGNRTIRLSRNLINSHSWDVVLHVLKHEMAHQVVSEIFKEDSGHGKPFQKACSLIGVAAEFRGASGDIPRILDDFHNKEDDPHLRKILLKAQKLLSLAESSNEHEASLAMEKANEFIRRYNLDRIEFAKPADYVYVIINHKKKRIENYHRRICTILMDYFFVEVIFSSLYDPETCEKHKIIELLGTVENVSFAEYVYHFLMQQLDSLWRNHHKKTHVPARQKRSYRLGVLSGFIDKLARQEARHREELPEMTDTPMTTSALVCTGDHALAAFLSARFPRLSRRRWKPPLVDKATYKAGVSDGKKITLHKGIIQDEGNNGWLLVE